MRRLDLDLVRHALTTARQLGYAEVELNSGEDHFHAKLAPMRARAAASEEKPTSAPNTQIISAPAVGYWQEAEPPIKAGSVVVKGDPIGAVVALGIGNDVLSNWTGTVAEIFVFPDQPVEFGQPLAKVEP